MPVGRGPNFKQIDIKLIGSSKYGIYPKQSSERTFNMTVSDDNLVPYPGYKIGLSSTLFNNSTTGRALYASVKFNKIFAIFGPNVYQISIDYDHVGQKVINYQVAVIGTLQTSTGVCYIAENNKPQILISDGTALYVFDPQKTASTVSFTTTYTSSHFILTLGSPVNLGIGDPVTVSGGSLPSGLAANVTYYVSATDFNPDGSAPNTISLAANPTDAYLGTNRIDVGSSGSGTLNTQGSFQIPFIDFKPGYITFHDTYFICAASNDTFYSPVANNTWRLSAQNDGNLWPDTAQTIGLLETKPDNTQAAVRFPSRGNMILVMGETVTEFWFDTGAQLFPYQRTHQGSIDYGCLNPATVAYMDEIVVWLGRNEKSGPIIMFSTGGEPEKLTTDGIDFELSELNTPQDSQGFLFRKNGHLFYQINFYTDKRSFVVDFNNKSIYNACDQNLSYYSMGQVVWFNNQYYSITKDNGNLFIFDTVFTQYQTVDTLGNVVTYEIPRMRICDNIRLPSQDYFILNDIGITIETGETDYQPQDEGPIELVTMDGDHLVTSGGFIHLVTMDGDFLTTIAGDELVDTQVDSDIFRLAAIQRDIVQFTPRVDLSLSYDGGATFGQDFPYILPGVGYRRNRVKWWQGGVTNDCVPQFKFWGIGRVVAISGEAWIRQ